MNQSVIVYGPQGCGKTIVNSLAFAKKFGLNTIIDNGVLLPANPLDHLYLTNVKPLVDHGCRVISFDDAMKELKS